ncbi:hypothetical protein EVJ58_g6108 [Rhodofomes roseus]|uniref:F-box domain-containing protein n=1 Tax=Rhodofomes roseus TaxID=34475 RepID=A0A4Y9YAZ5_9APHY|nr:hypothetical protein EVJ58_g6108 [Rhodofomes roseus]
MARRKAKHPKNSASAAERMNDEASGKRDVLADMPVDIMHEILLYLHPRELLSLSRTSKTTHSFLMKKSSASYWKESLKKVDGLPACPEKLIEPAWVALVFSTFCTVGLWKGHGPPSSLGILDAIVQLLQAAASGK